MSWSVGCLLVSRLHRHVASEAHSPGSDSRSHGYLDRPGPAIIPGSYGLNHQAGYGLL